jgi:stress response protein YsnF
VEHAIVIKPVHPIVLEQVDIRKKEVSDVQKFDEEVRSEDLKIEENVPPRRKSA